MKKVAVTGAAGFIGSNLSKALQDKGYELLLVDNFSRGKQKNLDYLGIKTECKNLDLRHPYGDVFDGVDTVFHCACRIGGEQFLHGSNYNELQALQDNLAIDRNVFRDCLRNKVKNIIFTSSVSIFNTSRQYKEAKAVFNERSIWDDPFEPEGGYGLAKYIAEEQLWLMRHMGINTSSVRIFKAYGPCDDYSEESGQVVLSLIRKALNYPKENYVVWGDGSKKRCLLYIDDLVDAMMKIHERGVYYDFNIGNDESTSIKTLAKKIAHLCGKDIHITYDLTKTGGPLSRVPDITKAKQFLDWKPKTSLDVGLGKTWKWMEEIL